MNEETLRSRITLFCLSDMTTVFLLTCWFWILRRHMTVTDDQIYTSLERSQINSPPMTLLTPVVFWKMRIGPKSFTTWGCTQIVRIRDDTPYVWRIHCTTTRVVHVCPSLEPLTITGTKFSTRPHVWSSGEMTTRTHVRSKCGPVSHPWSGYDCLHTDHSEHIGVDYTMIFWTCFLVHSSRD